MTTVTAVVDAQGRLVLPVSAREALGVSAGETVTVQIARSTRASHRDVARAKALVLEKIGAARLASELIEDRRRESERE